MRCAPVLEPLATVHRTLHPKADLALLQRAYEVADARHAGQKRKSGDPYITHPLAVATILAELGMDTTTLVAALLHDTVEDTDYSLERLRDDFGEEVAHLVDGVTKLDKVELGNAAEAETIRKMVVAMARDPRVLVIKLSPTGCTTCARCASSRRRSRRRRRARPSRCSRRWRTGSGWPRSSGSWRTCPSRSCTRRSTPRSSGWSPPAHRPGTPTSSRSSTRSPSSSTRRGSPTTVEGRPKHYYSIYRKMIVKGRDFDDIHDLVGVRVLVDEVRDCYAAMGMVHALWQPMPGRFKDYIAQPRFGVYQSLHTTVIGPDGKPLEVQIRTHEMHSTAEYGIAAHWRYKETRGTATGRGQRRDRRDGVDAPAARLAAGGGGPRRLPGAAALRPGRPGRSSCSRPRAT